MNESTASPRLSSACAPPVAATVRCRPYPKAYEAREAPFFAFGGQHGSPSLEIRGERWARGLLLLAARRGSRRFPGNFRRQQRGRQRRELLFQPWGRLHIEAGDSGGKRYLCARP